MKRGKNRQLALLYEADRTKSLSNNKLVNNDDTINILFLYRAVSTHGVGWLRTDNTGMSWS